MCKAWWEGGQCGLDADAVPVSEKGVGIVYFLSVAGGAGAKIEGSDDWKDWGGDSWSDVTSHRQGSARSCAGSQLPGWPYPEFLEDSVCFKQEDLHQRKPSPHLRKGRTPSLSLAISDSLSPRLKMLGFQVPLGCHYAIRVSHQRPQTPKLPCWLCLLVVLSETSFLETDQAGLELSSLWAQPPKWQDHRRAPPPLLNHLLLHLSHPQKPSWDGAFVCSVDLQSMLTPDFCLLQDKRLQLPIFFPKR